MVQNLARRGYSFRTAGCTGQLQHKLRVILQSLVLVLHARLAAWTC